MISNNEYFKQLKNVYDCLEDEESKMISGNRQNLKALQGAKNTIKAFYPKLAISIYHKTRGYFGYSYIYK